MPEVVNVPPRATREDWAPLARVAAKLDSTSSAITLSAQHLRRAEPFGTTLLAVKIAGRASANRSTVIVPPEDAETAEFLNEIGFPQGESGLAIQARAGALRMRHMSNLEPLFVEVVARLVRALVPGTPEDAAGLIELCLNEMLQNVFEHSGSAAGCFVHARWFRQGRNVKIAVADSGVGIAHSLRQNPKYASLPETELVRTAVMERGATGRTTGRFGGQGLKHLWELAVARSGRLNVLSGAVYMVIRDRERLWRCDPPFSGTVVEVDFRPGDLTSPSNQEGFF